MYTNIITVKNTLVTFVFNCSKDTNSVKSNSLITIVLVAQELNQYIYYFIFFCHF